MVGWSKPAGDEHVVFWFQCSQDGWDDYAGSKFTIEFQRSDLPLIGTGKHRHRISFFLIDTELQMVRQMQNNIIARLAPPPRQHFIYGLDESTVQWYLSKFRPIECALMNSDDIWLRYIEPIDVRRWAEFVLTILPRAIGVMSTL